MPKKRKSNPKKRLKRVSVRAERHEQVDWDKYAWALLQHVRTIQAHERAEPQPPEDTTTP